MKSFILFIIALLNLNISYAQSAKTNAIGLKIGVYNQETITSKLPLSFKFIYSKELSKRLELEFSYVQKLTRFTHPYLNEKEIDYFYKNNLEDTNEVTPPISQFNQIKHIGILISSKLNGLEKSMVKINIGTVYYWQNYSKQHSNYLQDLRLSEQKGRRVSESSFGLEIGIEYSYQLTNILSLDAQFNYLSGLQHFGIYFGGNVHF